MTTLLPPPFATPQEIAFLSDIQHMHRLIMHEKCHFMWANLFSASIRADWAAVGGWSEDAAATSGWTTTQTTQVQCARVCAPCRDRCRVDRSHQS